MLSFGGCLSAIGQTGGFGEFICSTTRFNWHAADFPSCKMMRWSVISVLGDLSRSNDTAKPGILPPRLQSGAPNPWDDLAVSLTISCMPQTAGSNPPPATRASRKRGPSRGLAFTASRSPAAPRTPGGVSNAMLPDHERRSASGFGYATRGLTTRMPSQGISQNTATHPHPCERPTVAHIALASVPSRSRAVLARRVILHGARPVRPCQNNILGFTGSLSFPELAPTSGRDYRRDPRLIVM